ncbi:hypothetical protein MNBD_PLANCTO03-1669 [hydrothermal vent metagenome]|uniref:Uncharacterized protein n=1 Tax=hydrothermal vent metagenome TaxID=652676 RepID=A0A3B1DM36_9ZZZZ
MRCAANHFARRTPRVGLGVLAVCLAGLLGVRGAAAEPDLGELVSRLPMSVDMVLAVDDGARLRRELGEMPLMLTMATLDRPAAVIEAWSGLADDLGMTDAEAFDLLLGQRLVIVGSDLQPGDTGGPHWAILSELDPATERKLRADLGAVPRRIVRGQPVMEFEYGSFLLATSSGRLRCTEGGTFESTPASTILLLAPASSRRLFEELLPFLHCQTPTRTLGHLPVGAAVAGFAARDAVLLQRLPDPATSPQRFFAANIGIENGVWQIEATAGPASAWIPGMTPGMIDRWSPELLDSLPQDPALVLVGTRQAVQEAREWAQPLIATSLPDPERDGLGPLLGDRSIFGVWLAADAPIRAEPEVLFATEAPDLARLIQRADQYLAEHADPALAGGANARLLPSFDEVPLGPTTVRSITLPLAPTADPALSPATSTIAPMLNWLYVPESEAAAGPGLVQPGWWVVHYDPTGTARPERTRQQSANPPLSSLVADLPARRYLHVGRALPQRWAARVAAFTTPVPRPETLEDVEGENGEGSGKSGGSGGGERVFLTSATVLPQIRLLEWAVWHEVSTGSIDAEITIDLRALGSEGQ